MKTRLAIAALACAVTAADVVAQADMTARFIAEPRLTRQMTAGPRRSGDVQVGETWQMSFVLDLATAHPRAWPARVHVALCIEDKDGRRMWRGLDVEGLRQTGNDEMDAAQIIGRQNIQAAVAGVEGRIIAWRVRVAGRLRIDPAKVDSFVESHVIARRDWTAPGAGELDGEPFREMEYYSKQIEALAAKVAVAR